MGLARLGDTPFVVIDLETTGIFPGRHERVIEVAALRVAPDGRIEDEFATLVNPKRDIGRADIHGITAGQLQHAPDFADVAGDIGDRLNGGIVVGHNLRFDLGFLRSEFDTGADMALVHAFRAGRPQAGSGGEAGGDAGLSPAVGGAATWHGGDERPRGGVSLPPRSCPRGPAPHPRRVALPLRGGGRVGHGAE